MELDKTTKTLIICLIYISGTVSVILNIIPYYLILLLITVLSAVFTKKISVKFLMITLLIVACSIFYTFKHMPQEDQLAKIAPTDIIIKGIVITEPKTENCKTKFELKVLSSKHNNKYTPLNGLTLVNIYNKNNTVSPILIGDTIELKTSIKKPYKATNPAQFDYAKYLNNNRIYTISYSKSTDIIETKHPESGKWFFIQKLNTVKDKILNTHKQFLKSPKLEILGGIVFGDYAVPTPKDIKQDFINSGLLHLLAASGMNVGMIYLLWFFIAKKVSVPYKVSIVTGAFLVLLYGFLTGFPPSVLRATLIFEFILLGKLIDRTADNLALLALVCCLMLLYDPYMVTNIGFQLSFLVSFGLLLCVEPLLEKIKNIPQILSGSILVPLIAQIWATPIQIYHFNSFSVYSVLANVLVLPISFVITYLGFISSVFSLTPILGVKICFILDKCAEPFISLLLAISKYISSMPHSIECFATPEIISIIIFYALVILLTISIKNNFSKKELNISLAIISVLLFVSVLSFNNELKIVFFDVGESDAILVSTPNHKNILIDTGDTGFKGYNSAKNIIIPYLRDKGIRTLDAMVLTHPDKDHIGGTLDILKNIKVQNIYENGDKSKSKTYKKIQKYFAQNNIKTTVLNDGDKINIDKSVFIQAIRQNNKNNYNLNDDSIILYIKYNEFSALLMGDAESNSINAIKKHIKSPVRIIKAGHHGSKDALNDEYIKYLNPEQVVISVGKNNYSHPHRSTLALIKKYNLKSYRTDKDSAILVNVDKDTYKIKRFSEENLK